MVNALCEAEMLTAPCERVELMKRETEKLVINFCALSLLAPLSLPPGTGSFAKVK